MEQGIGNKNKISLKFCLNSMLNERKFKKIMCCFRVMVY